MEYTVRLVSGQHVKMITDQMGMRMIQKESWRACARQALVVALLLATALGCAAVRGRRGAPEQSGFLGDYSGLAPREGYEAQEVYINPRAAWDGYDAIHLDSVTLWASEGTTKLGEAERQMLTDLLYASLAAELGERFRLAKRPGPDVLRMRAALTQAKGANAPLRALSTIVPQMLLISAAVGLSADVALTNLQYLLYYSLNDTTSIGAAPNIIINWEADSDDRYTVPIGLGINRTVQLGKVPVRLGVEFFYNVIRPDTVGADWNLRFYIIPAVPSAMFGFLN